MSRRGSSLIKLLVVIVIIAILIGLLLPAVQKVREAANRTKSMNNLKYLALAGLNYHDSMGVFPAMVADPAGIPTKTGNGAAFFQILPYLEQVNLFARFDGKRPQDYYNADNGLAQIRVDVFVSPADPTGINQPSVQLEVSAPNAKDPFPTKFTGQYATTSYCGNAMIFKPKMRITDIKDGTSMTLFFTERYQACQFSDKPTDVVQNLWAMGAYSATTPSIALALPEGDSYPRTTTMPLKQFAPTKEVPKDGDVKGTSGKDAIEFSAIAKAANASSGFQVMPAPGKCDPRLPQTPHRGGLMTCFCDGAVRSLNPTLSANVFWAMVTPQGSEPVSPD